MSQDLVCAEYRNQSVFDRASCLLSYDCTLRYVWKKTNACITETKLIFVACSVSWWELLMGGARMLHKKKRRIKSRAPGCSDSNLRVGYAVFALLSSSMAVSEPTEACDTNSISQASQCSLVWKKESCYLGSWASARMRSFKRRLWSRSPFDYPSGTACIHY